MPEFASQSESEQDQAAAPSDTAPESASDLPSQPASDPQDPSNRSKEQSDEFAVFNEEIIRREQDLKGQRVRLRCLCTEQADRRQTVVEGLKWFEQEGITAGNRRKESPRDVLLATGVEESVNAVVEHGGIGMEHGYMSQALS